MSEQAALDLSADPAPLRPYRSLFTEVTEGWVWNDGGDTEEQATARRAGQSLDDLAATAALLRADAEAADSQAHGAAADLAYARDRQRSAHTAAGRAEHDLLVAASQIQAHPGAAS